MNATHRPHRLLVLLLAATLGAGGALAAPPPWAGGGKNDGGDKAEKARPQERKAKKSKDERAEARRNDDAGKGKQAARKPVQPGAYFDDRNRDAVAKYYATPRKSCPPGLAKKNNGCLPPGQAKKWQVGQPLPQGVTVYPVPQQILVSLPPVPAGHRYVRVAGDILLIAVGTQMVVDGINGLLR